MFYTCAKELGLLNIVHSVLDKNTLEINTEGKIKYYKLTYLTTKILVFLSLIDWLILVQLYSNLPSTYLVINL